MKKTAVRKILFALGVIVSLVALTVLFLFVSTLKKTPPPQTDTKKAPRDTTSSLVKKVLPESTMLLNPGRAQAFTITLDPSLDPQTITFKLTSSPPSDASKTKDVGLSPSYKNATITLVTTSQIEPSTTYILTLFLRGGTIFRQAYLSSPFAPTPVQSNNASLSSFLPYETLNYRLEFNKEQNIYVMHFKYDANSKEDLSTQFNNSKTNADEFIESKGIDTTTVTIKYLYK